MWKLLSRFTWVNWLTALLVGVAAALVPITLHFWLVGRDPFTPDYYDRYVWIQVGPCGVLGFLGCVAVLLHVKRMNGVYETFANHVDGTVVKDDVNVLSWGCWTWSHPKAVVFSHHGAKARLQRGPSTVSSITLCTLRSIPLSFDVPLLCPFYSVQLTFDVPIPRYFSCGITPRDTRVVVGFLGMKVHDLRLGWPPFDNTFCIGTNDEAEVRRRLSREMQEELVQFLGWAREFSSSNDIEVTIQEASLLVAVKGLPWRAAELIAFYNQAVRLFDCVMQ